MPQELNSDSSFVTDSHCNPVKGTWPQCTSVKDLPGVICFVKMDLTNVCEENWYSITHTKHSHEHKHQAWHRGT